LIALKVMKKVEERRSYLIVISPIATLMLFGIIPIRAVRLLVGWGWGREDSRGGCQGQKRHNGFEMHDENWLLRGADGMERLME
jgi:hypothetical protein